MNPIVIQEVEAQTTVYGIKLVVSNAFKTMLFKWTAPIQEEITTDDVEDIVDDAPHPLPLPFWLLSDFAENTTIIKNSKLKKQKEHETNIEKKTFANKRTAQNAKKNATIGALEKIIALAFQDNANVLPTSNFFVKKPSKKQRMRLEQKRKNDRSEKVAYRCRTD